ncbi:MAG: periplasmic protein [Deltaproteobacteria bacterium]|nr:periplasmic protein [Deltaproteobacteria bacterium]
MSYTAKNPGGAMRSKSATLALLLAGCVLATPAVAQPDAWITAKTKVALLTTAGVHASDVNVDTVNGKVTLHGKVRSGDEKDKAEMVARKIDGVRSVRSLLQVVPARRETVVQRSDDHIKAAVQDALQADASLKSSSISVESVNNGVVLLGGTAQTVTNHLSAVESATSVPGVRQVVSEIQSPDTLADAEIVRESSSRPANTTQSVSGTARDMWITSATKMRLLADGNTPALDINVDTRAGVVTLFGLVPSQQAKASAEADARKVSGVKRVHNELQVVPQAKQEAVKVRDDTLRSDVKKAFENHEDLKDINVDVKNCVARLTGAVHNEVQRLEAAVVARSTHGVCSVQDDLHVSD